MTTPAPTKTLARSRSAIRRSTPQDVAAIRSWLEAEEADGVHGNFLCNWSVIARAHKDKELLVYIDGESGLPVAFQLGRLLQSGILQVKNDFRGRGIGRKMVEYCITLARRKGEDLLSIQCKPSTSIPFWKSMGFELVPGSTPPNKAYRVLERRHALPAEGRSVEVVVRFFPDEKKWNDDVPAYQEVAVPGKVLPSGVIQLGYRVTFHEGAHPRYRGVVVEAEIDGRRQFCDKARYPEIRARGVTLCRNGWFMDQLRPAASDA